MSGIKSDLFDFGEVILGVSVQHEPSHGNEGILGMQPYFGVVEGVVGALGGLFGRHDLHVHLPGWIVALLNGVVQVPGMVVWIDAGYLLGLFRRYVLDTCIRYFLFNKRLKGDFKELSPRFLYTLVRRFRLS